VPLGFGDAGVGFGGRLEGATEVGTVVVGTLVIGTADDDTDVFGPLEDDPVGVGTLDEAVPDAPPDPAPEDPVSDVPALDEPAPDAPLADAPLADAPLADAPSVPATPLSVPEPDPPPDAAPESARLVAVAGSDPWAEDALAIATPVGVAASLLEQADSISDPANAAASTGRRGNRPERAVVERMEDLC